MAIIMRIVLRKYVTESWSVKWPRLYVHGLGLVYDNYLLTKVFHHLQVVS